MKHLDEQSVELLEQYAKSLNLVIDHATAVRLVLQLDGLLEANTKLNLTRIVEPNSAIRLHTLDSLTALPEVLAAPEGDILDIGTGGGIPGLPLMIATSRRGVLIDSVAKKARAVAAMVAALGLADQVEVDAARAEDIALRDPARFAVVVARAVAPLPSLVELAAPLLKKNGVLVALKGRPEEAELGSGVRVAKAVGMRFESSRTLSLPGDGAETRTILVYRKVGRPSVRLPRRVGLAQSAPLG